MIPSSAVQSRGGMECFCHRERGIYKTRISSLSHVILNPLLQRCHRRAGENLGIRQGYSMGKDELLHVLHIWQCALHSLPLSLSSLRSDSRYSKFITFTVHLYHHCHPQKSCSPSQAHSVVGHVIDHEPPCYLPSLWRSQGTEDLALDMLYNRVWGHLDVNFQLLFFVSEETLKYEPSPLFIDF